jgi:hypothetical protein
MTGDPLAIGGTQWTAAVIVLRYRDPVVKVLIRGIAVFRLGSGQMFIELLKALRQMRAAESTARPAGEPQRKPIAIFADRQYGDRFQQIFEANNAACCDRRRPGLLPVRKTNATLLSSRRLATSRQPAILVRILGRVPEPKMPHSTDHARRGQAIQIGRAQPNDQTRRD